MNNKGGVGKTTTSDQLAVGIAENGEKVLLVDLDQQANTTDIFAEKKEFNFEKFLREKLELEDYNFIQFAKDFDREQDFDVDISDALLDSNKTQKAIIQTRFKNLDLLPSSMKLSGVDTQLKMDIINPQHNRLNQALNTVSTQYDYCVIDCPPILNILTLNALFACDEVIIPIKVDVGALKGFFVTLEFVSKVIKANNLNIKVRILFTMVNRNNVDRLTIEMFKKLFPHFVFETTIRNQPKAVSRAGFEQKLIIHDGKLNVGQDYQSLIKEIITQEKAEV